jgi:DNA-binding NtrC family response regulator
LLHEVSGRPGWLADISAGELDTALAPDDLFGHGRGAFTGAVERRRGLFVEAAGGTVLLDDFHWLRRSNQLRLLRSQYASGLGSALLALRSARRPRGQSTRCLNGRRRRRG